MKTYTRCKQHKNSTPKHKFNRTTKEYSFLLRHCTICDSKILTEHILSYLTFICLVNLPVCRKCYMYPYVLHEASRMATLPGKYQSFWSSCVLLSLYIKHSKVLFLFWVGMVNQIKSSFGLSILTSKHS